MRVWGRDAKGYPCIRHAGGVEIPPAVTAIVGGPLPGMVVVDKLEPIEPLSKLCIDVTILDDDDDESDIVDDDESDIVDDDDDESNQTGEKANE